MIVEVAKTQDDEVGDCTITAAVLAGEFLKNAEELLEQGVHPTVIASGYRLASVKAKEILKTLAKTVTLKDKDLLLKKAVTAITGKGAEASKDVFDGLAVTIPRASIRSIHQCLISALLPRYLFVVGSFFKPFYPFSFSYFLDRFSKHLCQFFIICFF